MDKITFVNNSEPDISAENLNKMQDNIDNAKADKTSLSTVITKVTQLEEKPSITIKLGSTLSDFSLNNQNKIVKLNQEYSKKGTGLTSSNGKIIVGSNVTNIIVSANLGGYLTSTGSGYIRLGILKNNNGTIYMRRDATISRRLDLNLTNILVPVSEGDEIALAIEASAEQSTSIENDVTYMTVFAV